MKDLSLMHYFSGLEVWQSLKRIFLNQGKYAVKILKRFDMLECKSMKTPMETKMKLLVDTSSELIDATLLNLKQLQEPFSGRMAKTLAEI
jgi:hypothetical protein